MYIYSKVYTLSKYSPKLYYTRGHDSINLKAKAAWTLITIFFGLTLKRLLGEHGFLDAQLLLTRNVCPTLDICLTPDIWLKQRHYWHDAEHLVDAKRQIDAQRQLDIEVLLDARRLFDAQRLHDAQRGAGLTHHWCLLRCRARWSERLKLLSQCEHLKGLAPVCFL